MHRYMRIMHCIHFWRFFDWYMIIYTVFELTPHFVAEIKWFWSRSRSRTWNFGVMGSNQKEFFFTFAIQNKWFHGHWQGEMIALPTRYCMLETLHRSAVSLPSKLHCCNLISVQNKSIIMQYVNDFDGFPGLWEIDPRGEMTPMLNTHPYIFWYEFMQYDILEVHHSSVHIVPY